MIFTDVDVLLDETIDNLMAWYADPVVGGPCGTLKYLGDTGSATASAVGVHRRLEEKLRFEESRTGNVMAADGSIFSQCRELYPEFPDTMLDDLTVSMAVLLAAMTPLWLGQEILIGGVQAMRGQTFVTWSAATS